MNLREWAAREKLRYASGEDAAELGFEEMVWAGVCCPKCGDVYVFRFRDSERVMCNPRPWDEYCHPEYVNDLSDLDRSSFVPTRFAMMDDDTLEDWAEELGRDLMKARMGPEDLRVRPHDVVQVLLTAALAIGRGSGMDDDALDERFLELMDGYASPEPYSLRMPRTS